MSAPIYVPEQTLVQWYFSPSKVERTERPKEPFDYPVEDLQASIDLTMRYITAAPQPLLDRSGRHLQTVAGPNDALTLFWPIYVDSNITVITKNDKSRTRTRILYYGFDAGRRLMVETVKSRSRESQYRNSYSWPNPDMIPEAHRKALLKRLRTFRQELSL